MTGPRTFQPSFAAQTRLAPIQNSRPLVTATGSKIAGDTTNGAIEGEDTITNFLLIYIGLRFDMLLRMALNL